MPSKIDVALKATSTLFKLVGGLYVIRMGAQKAGQQPNPVTLAQAPSGGGSVDFFPAENVTRNTLVNPGDSIVLRVKGEGATLVATEFHEGKPTQVRLQVDRIDATGAAQSLKTPAAKAPASSKAPAKPAANIAASAANQDTLPADAGESVVVNLVGHIQNRGDVVAKNDWLGKPGTNNRLEGFAIKALGLPDDIKLVYGIKFLSDAYKPQMSKEGKFVGTRRKAQGIQSVVFALEGDGADQYEIGGDVAFSGSVGCNIIPNQELKGPQGNEHLVAINLKLQKRAEPEQPEEDEDDGLWTEEDIRELFSL